eukprot:766828-Pleurochrysis_carterae.AAC.3
MWRTPHLKLPRMRALLRTGVTGIAGVTTCAMFQGLYLQVASLALGGTDCGLASDIPSSIALESLQCKALLAAVLRTIELLLVAACSDARG